MYQGYKLGIVVPAYNEEELIKETLDNMPDSADRIYVVDDGSTDATRQTIEASNDERICILSNGQNRGVGAAITTGYKRCLEEDIDIAVVMAGDNQMDPAELPRILAPIVKGNADYAKGNRMSTKKHLQGMTPWRRFGNWLLRWLTRIASGNYKIMDPQNGYTAISRKALEQINLDDVYPWYGYCNDILVKLSVSGARIVEVSMPARYGSEKSKIKYRCYIPKVSWLLLRDFLWRLKMKYLGGQTKR